MRTISWLLVCSMLLDALGKSAVVICQCLHSPPAPHLLLAAAALMFSMSSTWPFHGLC